MCVSVCAWTRVIFFHLPPWLRNVHISPLHHTHTQRPRIKKDEEEQLAKFKAMLVENGKHPMHFSDTFCQGSPDDVCLRFLRARKLDVDKAYEMISNTLEWRATNNVDATLDEPIDPQKLSVIRKAISGAYFGWDKEGRPLFIERTGKTDLTFLLENGISDADIVRKHIQDMEYLMNVTLPAARARAKGGDADITKICTILDLAGISMRFLGKEIKSVFKAVTSIDQNNYPETAGIIFLVNVPWIFNAIWKVASSFLDENTKKKVKLLPGSRLRDLHEYIDPEFLPQFLGGTHEDDMDSLYANMDADVSRRHRMSVNRERQGSEDFGQPSTSPLFDGSSCSQEQLQQQQQQQEIHTSEDEDNAGNIDPLLVAASPPRAYANGHAAPMLPCVQESASADEDDHDSSGEKMGNGNARVHSPAPPLATATCEEHARNDVAPTPMKEAATTLIDLKAMTTDDGQLQHEKEEEEEEQRVNDTEQGGDEEMDIFHDVDDSLTSDEALDPDVAKALLTLDVMIAHVNDIDIDALNEEENLEELVRAADDDDRYGRGGAGNGTGAVGDTHAKENANGNGTSTPHTNDTAKEAVRAENKTESTSGRVSMCCLIQ